MDLHGSRLRVQRTRKGNWFGAKIKTERVAPLKTSKDQDRRQKLFFMRAKWKRNFGEVQTAGFDVYHDPKMGKGLWQWISTWVMARGIFEKGERSLKNTIVPFKRFQKKFF